MSHNIHTMEIYALNSIGIDFTGKIYTNNPFDPKPRNLTGYDNVFVKFWKPNHVVIKKIADIVDEDNLDNTNVTYSMDSVSTSFLDLRGTWEYVFGVEYSNGSVVESPYTEIFFVVGDDATEDVTEE